MSRTELSEKLEAYKNQIDGITERAREALASAPETDELLEETIKWWGRKERYILIRPDGGIAHGFPFTRYSGTSFVQRPAAERALRGSLAGTRLYDVREGKVIGKKEDQQ